MQSRELPRIVTAEAQAREVLLADEIPRHSRFARLDFVRNPRRPDWFRLAVTFLLVGLAVWVAGYLGQWAIHGAVAWLHAQPRYQLALRDVPLALKDVQLVPPAPEWIRGGDRTILQNVLKNLGDDPVVSVPALEPGRLTEAFKKSPWVLGIQNIRLSYPKHLEVELRFRRPVAAVKCARGRVVVLDEDGVILPEDEIDTDKVALTGPAAGECDSLILILRDSMAEPKDRSPGVTWRTSPGDSTAAESDRRMLAAARLAGFFKMKERTLDPGSKSLRIYLIHINDDDKKDRGFFIQTFESVVFLWGPAAPGEGLAGILTAEEKWTMMREWAEGRPRRMLQKEDDFWKFQRTGLEAVHTAPPAK